MNQKVRLELAMGIAGFGQDDIKRALEPNKMDEKQMVQADEDIQKLLLGEKFRPFLKADTTYLQRILDYVYNTKLSQSDEDSLMKYLKQLMPLVIRNMYMKAQMEMAKKGLLAVGSGTTPGPNPDTPQATAAKGVINRSPGQVSSLAGATQQQAQQMPAQSQQQTANL